MDNKIITAVPKTAEEITGIVGCKAFSWYFEGDVDWTYYSRGMNELALKKERIQLKPVDSSKYDYIDDGVDGFCWRKEWLEDIQEEVDWTKVPVDAKIIVSRFPDFRESYKRHFAKFENEMIYAWYDGLTSWSLKDRISSPWKYAKLAEEGTDES